MAMEVVILGAGTAIPFLGYSPASILLRTQSQDALIDIGPGALQRAAQFGVEYLGIKTLFLTHHHSDHTLDLVTFLQANDSNPDGTRLAPLQIYGCLGTKAWYEKLMQAYPGISPSSYKLTIAENGQSSWFWSGLKVSTILTGHTETSLAYRFDGQEGSFIYTGDAVFSEELVIFSSNADLLVCECSFPTGWKTTDHMRAAEVGELAQRAGVKQLAVTHRYPPSLRADISFQIGEFYSGRITIAKDGSVFAFHEGIR